MGDLVEAEGAWVEGWLGWTSADAGLAGDGG